MRACALVTARDLRARVALCALLFYCAAQGIATVGDDRDAEVIRRPFVLGIIACYVIPLRVCI